MWFWEGGSGQGAAAVGERGVSSKGGSDDSHSMRQRSKESSESTQELCGPVVTAKATGGETTIVANVYSHPTESKEVCNGFNSYRCFGSKNAGWRERLARFGVF